MSSASPSGMLRTGVICISLVTTMCMVLWKNAGIMLFVPEVAAFIRMMSLEADLIALMMTRVSAAFMVKLWHSISLDEIASIELGIRCSDNCHCCGKDKKNE